MSDSEGQFFIAEIKLDPGLAREHCKAKLNQIQDIGRHRHEQVRVEFETTNRGMTGAILTVSVFHSDTGSIIYLGPNIGGYLQKCKLTDNNHHNICEGKVKAKLVIDGLSENDANHKGEFIEILTPPNSQNRKLIVIAPHGGQIEPHTDEQAQFVQEHLPDDLVTLWMCKGFSHPAAPEEEHDAHNRWHITATEISERAFPKLRTIIEPKFEYAIAFHGWDDDSICVGGNAESIDAGLVEEIKDAIKNALPQGSNIKVVATACGGGFSGDDPCNIVNRLGVKGVQIEQGLEIRRQHSDKIAQAVVDAIGPRINQS
jgi:phage replication-related protein YjqB (UPF0714/DUF867 family)